MTYRRKDLAGKSRITIYFPLNAEIYVKILDFGAAKAVPDCEKKFLILGDSLSQGRMTNSTSFEYTAHLKRFYDADMLNQSVGGVAFDRTALDEDLTYLPKLYTCVWTVFISFAKHIS